MCTAIAFNYAKRPDPPNCEAQGGPGLAMTAQSVSVHHDQAEGSKTRALSR
jgi:hypothetical protein